jgi:WS/DGAT/MGAT family acyltransferase
LAVADDWSPEPRPQTAGLLARAAVNNLVRGPFRLARAGARIAPSTGVLGRALVDRRHGRGTLMPRPVPRTRFQASVTPHRVLDSCAFPLDEVKKLRDLVDGSTVNDVIIAIVGGGVRRYLDAKGETPTEPLVCGAPVDLRKGQESVGGNDIAFLAVTLGADIDDPVERLRHVHDSTSGAKAMQRAVGARELSELSASFPGALSSWGFKTLASTELLFGNRLPLFNVGVSNVPGPQLPLYMNGARAERFFGVAPIFSGTALVFGVFSYRGGIEVTFVSCRRLLSDPEFLTECLRASYEELRSSEMVEAK